MDFIVCGRVRLVVDCKAECIVNISNYCANVKLVGASADCVVGLASVLYGNGPGEAAFTAGWPGWSLSTHEEHDSKCQQSTFLSPFRKCSLHFK